MARKKLGEILVDAGLLQPDQLRAALAEQQRWGGQLGRILIEKGFVGEQALVKALSRQLNFPVVDIEAAPISKKVLELVPEKLAEQHMLVPFQKEGKFLDVAMSDPMNAAVVDELRIRTQLNVRPYIAAPTAIQRAIRHNYGSGLDLAYESTGRSQIMDVDTSNIIFRRAESVAEDSDEDTRDAEIRALQRRLLRLESLVTRDEDVIRKLLGLLVEKGVASRDEILAAIKS